MLVSAKYKFVTPKRYVEHSIHLFRALLRESTYLPDASSRIYFKKYIKWRFQNAAEHGNILLRQLDGRSKSHPEHVTGAQDATDTNNAKNTQKNVEAAKEELSKALKKGYKGLSQLIRANEGELRPLVRVLQHTYGRNGPRRYELMKPLLTPDADIASYQGPEAEATGKPPREPDPRFTHISVPPTLNKDPKVTPELITYTLSPAYSKLCALAKSQQSTHPPSPRGRILRHLAIPAKNSWQRPMPLKRVKNLLAKKYARFLDAILPPLPEHEWLHLQGLASGTIPWEGSPKRRKWPEGVPPERLFATDLEKLAHVSNDFGEYFYLDQSLPSTDSTLSTADKITSLAGTSPTRNYWTQRDVWLGDPSALDSSLDSILEDELLIAPLNKRLAGKDRGHAITPRFMRRLYLDLFKTCPVLRPDTEAERPNEWTVTWGVGRERFKGSGAVEEEEKLMQAFFPRERGQKLEGGVGKKKLSAADGA